MNRAKPPSPPPLPHRSFAWGVSTSSYQIEGAAEADGRGPSIWDTHCRIPGRVANGDTGDAACDHYHRYAEDVALMGELGLGGYRFSVAWPRVLPQGRGKPNEAGLAFYDRLIDALLDTGIEPWLCLYHWDLPQALEDQGGWTSRASVTWFADYAALVGRRFGDRVKRFATFNEPAVSTLFGYGFGWNAPGLRDLDLLLRTTHHLNLAHGAAVDALRAAVSNASIGAIHNRQPCRPESASLADQSAAALLDSYWNRTFPDAQILGRYPDGMAERMKPYLQHGDLARIRRPIDWFGLNHYGPIYAKADPSAVLGFVWGNAPNGALRSEIGWHIEPAAFERDLLAAHQAYSLPIYVMENGYGARDALDATGQVRDQRRIDYLSAYIGAMQQAIAKGADVRGYFIWSLLDNFEWGNGYRDRFGLVYVDYPTQRRIRKDSFGWYAAFIRAQARQAQPSAVP